MRRVDGLVVPEEKSYIPHNTAVFPCRAHSGAMGTPLIPPPITRTSKPRSSKESELVTLAIRCFFGPGANITSEHYFSSNSLRVTRFEARWSREDTGLG